MRYVIVLLLAVTVLGGCATRRERPFNPYQVPAEQVHRRVHTIALAPIQLPDETEDRQAVGAEFESLISEALAAGGFRVVPAAEYEGVWRQMSARLGGVFDPVTGKVDEKKYEAAREHAARELARRDNADAILYPIIRVRPMRIRSTNVGLYAGGQPLSWQGRLIGWNDMPQKVFGTYLGVSLVDTSGVEMYSVQFPLEWTEIIRQRQHGARLGLYRDKAHNRR